MQKQPTLLVDTLPVAVDTLPLEILKNPREFQKNPKNPRFLKEPGLLARYKIRVEFWIFLKTLGFFKKNQDLPRILCIAWLGKFGNLGFFGFF